MIEISIIIVSYNTKEILKECLETLMRFKPTSTHEIIVIDNASKDESSKMVKEFFPSVLLIQNEQNLGFSKANNIGVLRAKGKHVLFLNSDAMIEKGTIDHIYEYMQSNQKVGAATCKVVLPDGTLDDASHRGFPTPWNALCHFSGVGKIFPRSNLLNGYHLGWRHLDIPHEIDALAGAFMMVRRTAGEQVGWWDEDFFWYGDDLDFCYRLKEKRWKIYYVPTVSVLHYKGVSGGIKKISKERTTADSATKIRAQNARFEAMKLFYGKHYRKRYPKILTWIVMQAIAMKQQSTISSLQ